MIPHDNPYQDYTSMDIPETIRQLRTMISEEYAAANLYENLAEVIPDEFVAAAVCDIADEERVHAGEFEQLIEYLQTAYDVSGESDNDLADDGKDEIKEMLEEPMDPMAAAEQLFQPVEHIIVDEPDYNLNVKFI